MVVDLRHCADSRAGSLDRVRLLNSDCRRNAVDVVNARLVHSIEELPHVWTERFDVTSLALSVNRLECQTRFAAAARAGNDGQFSQRKIDVYAFEIVLACAPNLDAIIRRRSDNPLCLPDFRTHWRFSLPVKQFANFCSRFAMRSVFRGLPPRRPHGDSYSSNRAASSSRCFCNSFGNTPPNESKYSLCAAISFCHSS